LANQPAARRRARHKSFTAQFALVLVAVGVATALAAGTVAWVETQHARSQQDEQAGVGASRLASSLVQMQTATASQRFACDVASLPGTGQAYTAGRASLQTLAEAAVASATPVASAKGIHLAESGTETGGPLVDVDPYALTRVVGNLLGNAIRHTPPDGSVDIGMVHDDDFVYLSISDECGGIADVDIDRVFEVAFRGAPARTPAPDGGAGLGLAIARGIVNAHNGRIGAENVGPGCRFTIALPRSGEVHTFDPADQPNGRIRGDAESLT